MEEFMNGKPLENYEKLVAQADKVLAETTKPDQIVIQVGSATCENAAGAELVRKEFQKHIAASERDDIVIRTTGCTGRCSREPIVSIRVPGEIEVKYQQVDRELVHEIFTQHILEGKPIVDKTLEKRPEGRKYQVMVCDGAPSERTTPGGVHTFFEEAIAASSLEEDEVIVFSGNCLGFSHDNTVENATRVFIRPDKVLYRVSSREEVEKIVESHLVGGKVVEELCVDDEPVSQGFFDLYGDVTFFRRQSRIALRNAGLVNPESIEDYIHFKGFNALGKVLEQGDPEAVVNEITNSNLRGRGGGGFPTGLKWKFARNNEEKIRYIICNADEGDPGAFMDRSMLESDPYSIVEGMIIGGFAIGAQQGFFYIRAEYPLAIRRIENAIAKCREYGLLGENILGSGFNFDLQIRLVQAHLFAVRNRPDSLH